MRRAGSPHRTPASTATRPGPMTVLPGRGGPSAAEGREGSALRRHRRIDHAGREEREGSAPRRPGDPAGRRIDHRHRDRADEREGSVRPPVRCARDVPRGHRDRGDAAAASPRDIRRAGAARRGRRGAKKKTGRTGGKARSDPATLRRCSEHPPTPCSYGDSCVRPGTEPVDPAVVAWSLSGASAGCLRPWSDFVREDSVRKNEPGGPRASEPHRGEGVPGRRRPLRDRPWRATLSRLRGHAGDARDRHPARALPRVPTERTSTWRPRRQAEPGSRRRPRR